MKQIGLILIFVCSTLMLYADQFAYIKPNLAAKAAELLQKEKDVLFLCEPCGEAQGKVIPLASVKAVDVNYAGNHEVTVNNEGIDLAYTYVRRRSGWRNLAIELGLKPAGVSSEVGPEGIGQPQTEDK